ncbi:Ssl1-like-domain-containing protein [Tuber indicum]|nr:Ssl1-like-domain-containing protein [Tuber indicum]
MADSDEDYIATDDEEIGAHNISKSGRHRGAGGAATTGGSGARSKNGSKPGGGAQKRERWEDIKRSWDNVVEGEDGSLSSTVAGLLEAGKRKRLLKDTTPLQRGIIRHLILILDLSSAMMEKDFRPTRYLLSLRYACDFVREYFEQNPISQLGVLGMRDGLAVRVSDLSGNPMDHIEAIGKLRLDEGKGAPSLQNALEMSRAALFHAPSHGTREVVIVFGALLSSDPGDIHQTINHLVEDKIRVSVVGLSAQVAVCRELCKRTNAGDEGVYGVALDDKHFRELLLDTTIPPVTRSAKMSASSLLMMGFPSRMVEKTASLCACHSTLTKGGYLCSRCSTKVCALPMECPACGLTLILSTHLARSYHHLFPLKNWVEVPWKAASKSTHCYACQIPFPHPPTKPEELSAPAKTATGTSVSSRYACTICHNHFCIDCDVFCHETLYNCPACQSSVPKGRISNGARGRSDPMEVG